MRKLVKRIVLYTKLDEGENKMSFRRKRDFVHDSEIRQNISKKIKNIHDDDFDKNIVEIFISHYTENKHDAKNIKNILCDFSPWIEVFVAHDDLQPAQNFEEDIIDKLKKCGLFILLVSKNIVDSNYVQQEIGMGKILNKRILPIRLDDTIQNGFIQQIQGIKKPELDGDLLKIIIEQLDFPTSILCKFLRHSITFKQTFLLYEILNEKNDFTEEDLIYLKFGLEKNSQISDSYKKNGISELIIKYEKKMNIEIDIKNECILTRKNNYNL